MCSVCGRTMRRARHSSAARTGPVRSQCFGNFFWSSRTISDPNRLSTPDHLRNWYAFWSRSLGKPVAKGTANSDGTVLREFENGTVVYNPMGNKVVTVAFPEERRSAATGKVARSHNLGSPDGDFFLKVK